MSFIGENQHKTILTYNDTNASTGSTTNSSSTMIRANDFYVENITFQNTAGNIMKIAISKARSILFFKRAEIKSLRNGYITASSTTESQKYGYVLIDSTLKKGTAAAQSVYLGRPWRPHSAVTFLYTKWMII